MNLTLAFVDDFKIIGSKWPEAFSFFVFATRIDTLSNCLSIDCEGIITLLNGNRNHIIEIISDNDVGICVNDVIKRFHRLFLRRCSSFQIGKYVVNERKILLRSQTWIFRCSRSFEIRKTKEAIWNCLVVVGEHRGCEHNRCRQLRSGLRSLHAGYCHTLILTVGAESLVTIFDAVKGREVNKTKGSWVNRLH